MKKIGKAESAYNFLLPLFFSGVFFLLSFYLCIYGIPFYIYTLPLYAMLLFISLFLFYRMDKKLHQLIKKGKKVTILYDFYHHCIGIYLILSVVLFGVSVAYLPFYRIGGSVFVWYCAPMSLLCLISFVRSRKRKKWLAKIILRQKSKSTRAMRLRPTHLKLVVGRKQSISD